MRFRCRFGFFFFFHQTKVDRSRTSNRIQYGRDDFPKRKTQIGYKIEIPDPSYADLKIYNKYRKLIENCEKKKNQNVHCPLHFTPLQPICDFERHWRLKKRAAISFRLGWVSCLRSRFIWERKKVYLLHMQIVIKIDNIEYRAIGQFFIFMYIYLFAYETIHIFCWLFQIFRLFVCLLVALLLRQKSSRSVEHKKEDYVHSTIQTVPCTLTRRIANNIRLTKNSIKWIIQFFLFFCNENKITFRFIIRLVICRY